MQSVTQLHGITHEIKGDEDKDPSIQAFSYPLCTSSVFEGGSAPDPRHVWSGVYCTWLFFLKVKRITSSSHEFLL